LSGRLARLYRKINKKDRKEIEDAAEGKEMNEVLAA